MTKDVFRLIDLFDTIQTPSMAENGTPTFSALPIPGYEKHRLGKDSVGSPTLLVSVANSASRIRPTPIALEHLRIEHDVSCRISHPSGNVEQSTFTVIRCVDSDAVLATYFLRVVTPILVSLGYSPSDEEVARAIGKLVELFKALTELPKKSLRGLWGELFIIHRSREPTKLVEAWHLNPNDRYDFVSTNQRLEVKSSATRIHEHYFSLEQLTPPAGTQLLVASVFVERSSGGVSVIDLAEQIRSRIGHDSGLLMRLDRNMALILGNSWRVAVDERFDRDLAETNLAFYRLEDIPTVEPRLPSGVSEVRFKSDLSAVQQVDLAYYRSLGGLFRAAIKK